MVALFYSIELQEESLAKSFVKEMRCLKVAGIPVLLLCVIFLELGEAGKLIHDKIMNCGYL